MATKVALLVALTAMLREFDEYDGENEKVPRRVVDGREAALARNRSRNVYRRAKGVAEEARNRIMGA